MKKLQDNYPNEQTKMHEVLHQMSMRHVNLSFY